MGPNNILTLQNGSDIRGIAVNGVIGENVNLTSEIIEKIAVAYVHWLGAKLKKPPHSLKVAVGRDSRISGPVLMDAFIRGVRSTDAHAIDCSIASTPAMYMSTIFDNTKYDGAAMLTASHLPYNRNGIKLFTPFGGLEKQDITEILTLAAEVKSPIRDITGKLDKFDLISRYSAFLVDTIRKNVNNPANYNKPLAGFHIVVDAGNGAGGFFAGKVLNELGADTSGSQFLEPDGMFPNHIPNPEDSSAMEYIQKAVIVNKADLGIIFDTDVDRAAAVDQFGNNINRNSLIALIAAILLEEHPGTTIVTDSLTSDGLKDFIEKELKGKHHRFKRGYKNVINEAIRLNNAGDECWIAIETSGHAALKENYFLDDGAFLITKLLIKAAKMKLSEGKSLTDLIHKLRLPAESSEFRMKIKTPDFKAYGNKVIADLEKYVGTVTGWDIVPNNYEGIRVSCDKSSGFGWFLLRVSLHDPELSMNAESEINGGVKQILQKLVVFFKGHELLDISSITSFIK
jgi:phosphomannomutase